MCLRLDFEFERANFCGRTAALDEERLAEVLPSACDSRALCKLRLLLDSMVNVEQEDTDSNRHGLSVSLQQPV